MQTIKRVLKKISAISTGAVMMGASLTGALAADLADYPDPFVVGGSYNDAAIVTSSSGADANSALLIVNGLSQQITSTDDDSDSGTSYDDGYKLEYSGNKFNLNDTAYDIDNKLSKTQLPVILAKETFEDVEGTNTGDNDYKQELLFRNRGDNSAEKSIWLIYDQDKEDSDKPMGNYLYLSKTSSAYAWSYLLDFDSSVTVANSADLASNKLTILGRTFTISSATVSNFNVTKLTLLAGEVTQVVATGDTVSGVTLTGVDANGNSCTIEYDGTVYTINDGATRTMPDGTIIGVTKVTPIDDPASPDYCELNIGADKVEIENGKEVKINGDKVTGTTVEFSNGFDYINVSYKPDTRTYLKVGDEFEDPMFGAFKLVFASFVDDDPEDISLVASGEKVSLTATNKNGDEITWDIAFANTTGTGDIMPGSDIDEPFIALEGDFVTNTSMGESELSAMTGIRFLFSFNDRSSIIKIKTINTLDNKTTFYDETTETEYSDQEFTPEADTAFSFLSSNFAINFSRSTGVGVTDQITFADISDKGPSYMLKNGGNITFRSNWSASSTPGAFVLTYTGLDTPGLPGAYNTSGQNYWFSIGEVDTGKETNMLLNVIKVGFTYSSTNQEINFAAASSNSDFVHRSTSLKQKDKSDTTIKAAKTIYGTYVEQLTPTGAGTDSIDISTPDTASYGEVWVVPLSAEATVSGAAVTSGYTALDDTEVVDVTAYNAVVVGGPCANTIAADLLGVEFAGDTCAGEFTEGEAVIELKDNAGKTAMIVAGYARDDTRKAAKVLESFDAYELSGSKATVKGTLASPVVATEAE